MTPYPGNLTDPDELYANISEADFQRDVIKIARDLGFSVYSHNTVGSSCPQCGTYVRRGRVITSKGWPDLCMGRLDPSRLIFAELKSKKGKMSKEQEHWQAILEANGAEFYLWLPENRDEAVKILARR